MNSADNLLIAALRMIDNALAVYITNQNMVDYVSPFDNTANHYGNDVFCVKAYDWSLDDEGKKQDYNFKWRDIVVTWYRYCGRGMEYNKELTPNLINEMLNDCVESLSDAGQNKP